jgi:excinuclease ABC subunit A
LKDLAVDIPLSRFVCLTGVSGSGKTTLARDILLPALQARLRVENQTTKASDRLDPAEDPATDEPRTTRHEPPTTSLTGWRALANVVLVDQSPLGKTPRSNPAVYLGAFDHIRDLFAQSDLARQRGLNASAFSFNSGQGQCERCRGAGCETRHVSFLDRGFSSGRWTREVCQEIALRLAHANGAVSDV